MSALASFFREVSLSSGILPINSFELVLIVILTPLYKYVSLNKQKKLCFDCIYYSHLSRLFKSSFANMNLIALNNKNTLRTHSNVSHLVINILIN